MSDSGKTAILNRIKAEGYSGSYGELLCLTAAMGTDPKTLDPETEAELIRWEGHFEGLMAALHCLVMHEQNIQPEKAALVVDSHITDAIEDLNRGNGTGTGA
ncbi:MAG: hypothetical protein HOV67_00845 [Kribbellaceae bacterium]|nr:hypothetical protein [Kribbellaceae bacterium]